jgi:hypothetical protein
MTASASRWLAAVWVASELPTGVEGIGWRRFRGFLFKHNTVIDQKEI